MSLKHEGDRYKIYYIPVDDFISDLSGLGRQLDIISRRGEELVSVITNTGIVGSSMLLGPSFQGVKGFAVITRKSEA